MAVLAMSIFLLPTLYVWFGGEDEPALVPNDNVAE
jgi:hypothetical protein